MLFVRNASKDLNAFCLIKRFGNGIFSFFAPITAYGSGLVGIWRRSSESNNAYPLARPALLE